MGKCENCNLWTAGGFCFATGQKDEDGCPLAGTHEEPEKKKTDWENKEEI